MGGALLCLIVAITDGDTLKARCGAPGEYEQITIRVSAIDAPEKRQPFGQRSRESLSALCFHEQAQITQHGHDRYGRTAADVECRGKDAGQEQVKGGMAWVFDRYAKGYAYLYPMQDEARAASRGLWSDPAPIPPWEWRHRAPG